MTVTYNGDELPPVKIRVLVEGSTLRFIFEDEDRDSRGDGDKAPPQPKPINHWPITDAIRKRIRSLREALKAPGRRLLKPS